ncbi:potassium voltage-gated channel subfamily A member 1-like isoform X2 [Clytia hemisphaerica]|uniref:potassium voltage-gated channel subfamily A member 1-like isoform X2 n=1 Tax=Clytia hemisphaerica TaxID=252671 RepID=UPI0034D4E403
MLHITDHKQKRIKWKNNTKCGGMVRKNKKISINVRGTVYETFEETLQRFPHTLLGDPTLRISHYDVQRNSLYFDNTCEAFDAILFYYQSNGCLVRPPWVPMEKFEFECLFFKLGENAIKSMKEREGYDTQKKVTVKNERKTCRRKLWNFLEKPESSLMSRLYTFLSLMMVFFSITLDCFETTLPVLPSDYDIMQDNWEKTKLSLNTFFAAEFIIRFSACPYRRKFCKAFLNIVDFFAIFPSFLTYFLDRENTRSIMFVRVLRTLRVLRLIRLSKSFQTLSVVLHILVKSLADLLTLIFCMLISCTIFGSIIYYAEHFSESPDQRTSQISSIPEGMYFAMQTVVSIGYGDIVPSSFAGKITTAMTAIVGALTMTVPLLSLGGKYFATYTKTFDVNLSADLINTPGPNVQNEEAKKRELNKTTNDLKDI